MCSIGLNYNIFCCIPVQGFVYCFLGKHKVDANQGIKQRISAKIVRLTDVLYFFFLNVFNVIDISRTTQHRPWPVTVLGKGGIHIL